MEKRMSKRPIYIYIYIYIYIVICAALLLALTACNEKHVYNVNFDENMHWLECECGEKIDETPHGFSVKTDDEKHWLECECGFIKEETVHDFVINSDDTKHWLECECGIKKDEISHSFETKSNDEKHWLECGCGYKKDEKTHVFVTKSDDKNHWLECECGKIKDVSTHVYDVLAKVDSALAQKMICGSNPTIYYKSCSCGAIGQETFSCDDEKDCHVVQDGKCIYCRESDFICEHFELTSFILDKCDVERAAYFACEDCNTQFIKSVEYSDLDIPIVSLSGDIASATKTNKVEVAFSYLGEKNFDSTGTVKWQGSSSSTFPKKNYTLKLDSKIKLNDDWGKQKKYCLKANWVDFSQARNVVSGRLYSQIANTCDVDDNIADLNNGGVVDGYPVLVFQNGVYHGLYTLNIPKDKWMFGMSDSDEKTQAILMGDFWADAPALRSDITSKFAEGVALEYYCNEDSEDNSVDWIVDSFNAMGNFVRNNDGETFKEGIGNYLNVERCIDQFIYTTVLCAYDNTSKNMLWVTYDGKTWQSSPYDMDDTWGMVWDGSFAYSATSNPFGTFAGFNELWKKLYANYYDEIKARYLELREDILSLDNIKKEFSAFFDTIPTIVVETEKVKWSSVPSQDINNYNQIITWAEARLTYLDNNI